MSILGNFWHILKLGLQKNQNAKTFEFCVMLKVISWRFTCQKIVRFARIGFFSLDFKEKHFLSSRQGCKDNHKSLQRRTKSQIFSVLLTFCCKMLSFFKSTLNFASFEYKTLLIPPTFTT